MIGGVRGSKSVDGRRVRGSNRGVEGCVLVNGVRGGSKWHLRGAWQ